MSSNDFDFIRNTIKHFVEENKFTILNSREDFITDNILNFFNTKNNTSFKKTLRKTLQNKTAKTNNTNIPKIEMSEIIKGDFIVFEDYDLFQYHNISENLQPDDSLDNVELFTESFGDLF